MSTCARCGATFSCAMADTGPATAIPAPPCWCTYLPLSVPMPVPGSAATAETIGCWCPACLAAHIQLLKEPR